MGRAALQVLHGQAMSLASSVHVSGHGEHVTSTTVTSFDLDDVAVLYSGGSLPMRAGDRVTVAGRFGDDGIFYAYAMRLPRQRVTVGGASFGEELAGVILVGCAVIATLLMGRGLISDSWLGRNDAPFLLLFTVAFAGMLGGWGWWLLKRVSLAKRARAMLDGAPPN